jgi:hypothetical protein
VPVADDPTRKPRSTGKPPLDTAPVGKTVRERRGIHSHRVSILGRAFPEVTGMSLSDEIIEAEQSKIQRLLALEVGVYDAITAVEAGVDVDAVESLVGHGVPVAVALARARPDGVNGGR